MRIQRPSTRSWLTTLNDCEPPQTCITARVLPCVGRTAPMLSGIQSICDLNTPVIAPWRSGEHQTMPSDQSTKSRSSLTMGWSSATSSASGKPEGLKIRVSAPKCSSSRAASSVSKRLKARSRVDPYRSRMRGLCVDACSIAILSGDGRSTRSGSILGIQSSVMILLLGQGYRCLIEPATFEPQGDANQRDQYRDFHQRPDHGGKGYR
ncbi:hypothetical protein D3C72_1088510 [compost metagenome]